MLLDTQNHDTADAATHRTTTPLMLLHTNHDTADAAAHEPRHR
jgi:hypothetical protein